MKIKREIEEDLIVTWTDSNGVEHERDVTPADLERTGWVPLAAFVGPLDLLSPPTLAGALEAIRRLDVDAAAQPDPGTLAHLRADLRDAVRERDELRHHYDAAGPEHNLLALLDSYESDADTARAQASAAYAMVVAAIGSVGAETIEAAVARLVAQYETLRAEVDDVRLALDPHSHESKRGLLDMAHDTVRAVRDEGLRAARFEAERDTLRAELAARLTAPGEGSCWACREDLGVAHERARHAPAPCTQKDRATDEELVEVARTAYDWGRLKDVPWVDRIALAVAARVRKERCLVAQAVAANVDIRVCEDDGGGFMVGVHESGCDEELARCVPAADVPATLARLLGEVSRG